ncbi:MAG: carbonic anhydrase family protein [Thermoleophilia bacterium]|nr:carbonic anhydrase family protein [Thermoleophilia bacterium]
MSSAAPDAFADLLAANDAYVDTFALGHLEARALRGLAIVTCFDSRIEPLQMLGLAAGDAKILRTAGGRVGEGVLDSLRLAIDRLGVDRIAIVQHTECAAPTAGVDTLAHDVSVARATLGLPHDRIDGFIYDVRTGRISSPAETD